MYILSLAFLDNIMRISISWHSTFVQEVISRHFINNLYDEYELHVYLMHANLFNGQPFKC